MLLSIFVLSSHCKEYVWRADCAPHKISLTPGVYQLEVYGAANTADSAKGGYAKGFISITNTTTFFVNVGGQGGESTTGCNGGGRGADGFNGGGGTDIRAYENTIYHRIIVAGGAGGSQGGLMANSKPYGGGINGGEDTSNERGQCGKQNLPGLKCTGNMDGCGKGAFGKGGDVLNNAGGGGGGGWFGGASGKFLVGANSAGGGGSGFVLNKTTVRNAPLSYKLANNKEVFLFNTEMSNGDRSKNGLARIELIHTIYTVTPIVCPICKTLFKYQKSRYSVHLQYALLFTALE